MRVIFFLKSTPRQKNCGPNSNVEKKAIKISYEYELSPKIYIFSATTKHCNVYSMIILIELQIYST